MRRAALGLVAMLAACFTGDSAQGLPCSADEFCAGLKCIDGFCGGAPDSVDPTSGTPTSTEPTVTASTDPSTSTDPSAGTMTTTDTDTASTSTTSQVDTSGSETTGPATCDLGPCWGGGCFSRDLGDRFATDGRPTQLAVARLDEDDAYPDLLTANVGDEENEYALQLRRGIEGGLFHENETTTRPLADNPDDLVVGDLDSEAHLDAVVVYQGSDQLSIFLWTVTGFVAIDGDVPQPTGDGPRLPILIDIDGDSEDDVAYVVAEGVEVFASIAMDGAQQMLIPHGFYFEDLIGVVFGDAPALLGTHMSIDEATIYRPIVDVNPQLMELRYRLVDQALMVAATDLDVDGDQDAVVISANHRIWKIPNFLDERSGDPVMIGAFDETLIPYSFAIGQLDGQCGLDVAILMVAPDPNNHDVLLFRNEGDALSDGQPLGEPGTNAIAIVDLDGVDGGIDELVLASDAGYVQIARYFP